MASKTPASKDTDSQHLLAAETILTEITDTAGALEKDPREHLHVPAHDEKAHGWFRSYFPYTSLEDFESQWHLGNYIIDRKTGKKTFEAMSIYVRLGMHLIYYGTEQENMLQWKRTQALIKQQTVKMGQQYDSPASKSHIQPFIDSFHLQDVLQEFVSAPSGVALRRAAIIGGSRIMICKFEA